MNDTGPVPTPSPSADLTALTDGITPEFAAGLVKAQAEALNVESNRENKHSRYKYANLAALLDGCRHALAAGGLAIMRTGWQVEPVDDRLPSPAGCPPAYGTAVVTYLIIHESAAKVVVRGQCDIYTNKGMPTDKATFAALTMTDRYVRSAVVGVFWDDPNDVDQRKDDGLAHRQPPSRPSEPPPRQAPPPPPPPRVEPTPHPNEHYQTMLVASRLAFRDCPLPAIELWRLATGLETMPTKHEPDSLRPHMLRAVRMAPDNIKRIETANAAPEKWTHDSYAEACESLELDFAMRQGRPTGVGISADALVDGEGPPDDGTDETEPPHDPETGEVYE